MTETVEPAPATGLQHPGGLVPNISLPASFHFNQVLPPGIHQVLPPVPTLGPLAAFVGTWTGKGFNTIFRPNSSQTPTKLPIQEGGDNVLELNLTQESLAFSQALGRVPNRGMKEADVFLNGLPYVQTINDVTTDSPVVIHFEPGLWICVPPTSEENVQTVARMGSIPHGTTILAQGTSTVSAGPPTIPAVSITPFPTQPAGTHLPPSAGGITFPSQTASNPKTARMPQDLAPFITAGTITQAMLDDPNTLLRSQISALTITSTSTISISTAPTSPLFGGGSDNIAFLLGSPGAQTNPLTSGENAQALQMTATFWIETVQHSILVPVGPAHQPLTLTPEHTHPNLPSPIFTGTPPKAIPKGHVITVESTQIQYSQTVMLNFAGLTWPHVSVATLVPAAPIPLAPSVWH